MSFAMLLGAMARGQQFQFGATGGMITSQIDGDNLRGFNKFGYQAGLLGGYAINDKNWIAVELRYAFYGSKKKQEQVANRVAADLRSIDIVAAYSRRFGDAWQGNQKFRFLVGPRLHRVISVKSGFVNKQDLRLFYVSGHLGLSHLVSASMLIDLTYTHGFTDLLKSEITGINKLQPYYLSLGVSYYLNY